MKGTVRILDVGVAAAYAVLCLSLVSFMSPYAAQRQSAEDAADSAAASAVFSYVGSVGLPFLSSAQPAQVCSSLEAASTSAIVLGGEVSGTPCDGAPSGFLGTSTFAVILSGRQVEIEAWVLEEE